MIFKSPNIQLIPFVATDWVFLCTLFYDPQYQDMWRHHPRAMTQADFENYPRLINGEVFTIYQTGGNSPIGIVQIIPDCKTNRGFFLGLIIEKNYQKQHLPYEVVKLMFNYAFNRLGYRKAIVEVCEKNNSLNNLLVKMNFIHEGKLIGESFQNGEYTNENRYCMLASFFNKHHKGSVEAWAHL